MEIEDIRAKDVQSMIDSQKALAMRHWGRYIYAIHQIEADIAFDNWHEAERTVIGLENWQQELLKKEQDMDNETQQKALCIAEQELERATRERESAEDDLRYAQQKANAAQLKEANAKVILEALRGE